MFPTRQGYTKSGWLQVMCSMDASAVKLLSKPLLSAAISSFPNDYLFLEPASMKAL